MILTEALQAHEIYVQKRTTILNLQKWSVEANLKHFVKHTMYYVHKIHRK